MRLLFLTSGRRAPSTRFRMLPLLPYLRRMGHSCTVAHSFPEKYDYFPWLGFRPSQLLKRWVRYGHLLRARWGRFDAIILEREIFHNGTWDLEQRFRRVTRTLVLDVDDAVFLNFPEKFPHLVRMSDLVLAGNRSLEKWLEPFAKPVTVIPTCVDTSLYRPRRYESDAQTGAPVVGWIGTSVNISNLRIVAAALRSLATKHAFELRVISSERAALDDLDLQGVRVRFQAWNATTEPNDVREMDIGLMPLNDDEWSRYKCGLKLLEYMSVAIPGVASPVGVNVEIVTPGVDGLFATTTEEWEQQLGQLLGSPQLRQRMGFAARQTVEQRYSIAAHLPRWIAAVEEAVHRTRHPHP